MRIGLSTSLVQRGRSGVGQYVVNLLAALLRESPRDEFVIFTLEGDAELFRFMRGSARLVVVGEGRRSPAQDVAWHQLSLPRLAVEHELDVLHVPSHRRMLWRHPCALVTTAYDIGAFRVPRDPRGRGSCPSAVFRALARRQDEIVTPTRHAAEELIALTGMPASRVTAVAPGVDHRTYRPGDGDEATTTIARRYAVRPPFFLTAARLDGRAHNHERLIAAFNAFKTATPSPWQLVFIGPDGSGADEIRRHVLRSPYAPDIHCLGYVRADEMPCWYQAAGALVYAPLRWGFGLPLLEAMACGCPILTADAPAAHELCGEAAMYVDLQDTNALQAGLAELASDPARRAQLSDTRTERIRRFDWAESAAAMIEVYARASHRLNAVMVTPAVTTAAH